MGHWRNLLAGSIKASAVGCGAGKTAAPTASRFRTKQPFSGRSKRWTRSSWGKLLVQWETDRFGWTAGGLLGIDGKAVGNGGQHLLGAVDLKSGLGWMRRIVIAEYYQWKPEIKQPREATSAKSLQHNRRHETMLINLFTSPA